MKENFKIIKVKITADMVGQDCFIIDNKKIYNKCSYGELTAASLDLKITPRSLDQHRLLFAIFKEVSEQLADNENFNTVEKVKEQCKIACKFFDCYYFYENQKTGKKELNIKTKSIAFDKLDHYEACGLFDEFFEYCAGLMGIDKEILIKNIKEKNKLRPTCVVCGKRATQRHHKFANTKQNRAKYGKLIDADFNLVDVCHDCHASHSSPELCRDYIYTEKQFLEEMEKHKSPK
jgi:hypothetical protein